MSRYRSLTQHNPSLSDPVIRAVKEDWEELVAMIENLIEEREQALATSRDLQQHQTEMDEDLENYVRELERIEQAENTVLEKSGQLKVGG